MVTPAGHAGAGVAVPGARRHVQRVLPCAAAPAGGVRRPAEWGARARQPLSTKPQPMCLRGSGGRSADTEDSLSVKLNREEDGT